MSDNELIKRTYMLMPSDDEILERHAEHLTCSKSAMLRIILRDWNTKAGRTLIDPPVGYHADRPGEFVTAQVPDGGR